MENEITVMSKKTGEVLATYTRVKEVEYLTMDEAIAEGHDCGEYDDYTTFFRLVLSNDKTATFPCTDYKIQLEDSPIAKQKFRLVTLVRILTDPEASEEAKEDVYDDFVRDFPYFNTSRLDCFFKQ